MTRLVMTLLAVAATTAVPLPGARAQDAPFPIAAWSRTTAGAEDQGSAVERGAAVFNNWCSACHSRGPQNAPGTTSLQFKYQGSVPAALEDRRDLTAQRRRDDATAPQDRGQRRGSRRARGLSHAAAVSSRGRSR
jgi:mono/diheme cytochrome c family protein